MHPSIHPGSIRPIADRSLHSPERCHSDDGVPERLRNAGEFRLADVFLCVVHDGGEDDDGHAQRKEQEAEFAGAAFQRVAENTQTLWVATELEDAEDPENSQSHESTTEILVVWQAEADVVRKYGDGIDDAHHRAQVARPVRRRVQTHEVLGCEDDYASRVEAEEFRFESFAATRRSFRRCWCRWRWRLKEGSIVDQRRNRQFICLAATTATARNRLHDVRQDRNGDEEAGDVIEDEGCCARLWIFEGSPHALPQG